MPGPLLFNSYSRFVDLSSLSSVNSALPVSMLILENLHSPLSPCLPRPLPRIFCHSKKPLTYPHSLTLSYNRSLSLETCALSATSSPTRSIRYEWLIVKTKLREERSTETTTRQTQLSICTALEAIKSGKLLTVDLSDDPLRRSPSFCPPPSPIARKTPSVSF